MNKKDSKLTSIEKALEILLLFNPRNQEMGTVELSQKTGFHRATVNRILQILSQKRFLQQNPKTKKFNLGSSIIILGESAIKSLNENILSVAIQHIKRLCDSVCETVVMVVNFEKFGVVVYAEQGNQILNVRARIGVKLPLHAAAGPKSIIAFSEPETVELVLNRKLKRFTRKTIIDPEKLRLHLNQIKKDGIAFCQEEIVKDINAIGAPILNNKNRPVSAIAIWGPSARVKCSLKSPLVTELKKTTSKIEADIYNTESPFDIEC